MAATHQADSRQSVTVSAICEHLWPKLLCFMLDLVRGFVADSACRIGDGALW